MPAQMPEGDTIWRSASAMRRRLAGRTVTAARPPALRRLTGRRLHSVEPVGKHLYMRFDGDLVLHTHMRMTGAWHLYAAGEPWRRAEHRATAVLEFDDVQAVLFAAPVCELVTPDRVGAGLGPDILATGFDLADAVSRARSSDRATVGEVLLDQSVCAGIGIIYRCEALWHERVDPFAALDTVEDPTLRRVIARARDLLRRAAVADGFRASAAVHGRAGRPCAACGTVISADSLGRPARVVFWCPTCQGAAKGAGTG
jgi:endonuclease-8